MSERKSQLLYSVALEYYSRKRKCWRSRLEYLHADDAGHARTVYIATNYRAMMRSRAKIVGVGLVVGYHTPDEGKTLIV